MNQASSRSQPISRRRFLRDCTVSASALASFSILGCRSLLSSTTGPVTGPASRTYSLDHNWLFDGEFNPKALTTRFDDTAFSRVTVPHCVTELSWQNWDPATWARVWIYRRHFTLPKECRNLRVFLDFDGVMVGTTPVINGHPLPQHLGGYLPSRYELTDWLDNEDNVLAVVVDSRWSNVPPEGSPDGPKSIDYLEPGGIFRGVRLQAVPPVFISDVFAKPMKVLDADRRMEVTCSIDAGAILAEPARVQVELKDGARVVARVQQAVRLEKPGLSEVTLTLAELGNVALWEIDTPRLYDVVATLLVEGRPVHDYQVRTGLRDARFEVDGFFLNGRRFRLFGLNRHELFPYVGFAMPRRVMRRDAEILRREFNGNVVRCSHYPQSEAFLAACDELGLMVWEETPGWQYLGDAAWKELVVRDVGHMVTRDRNHPAIIIWGVRVNESQNDPALYERTRAVAKSLDDSRPTSGSMAPWSVKNWKQEWHQDVFAFDDYHSAPDGSVGIRKPLPGVPYMLAETVGQCSYAAKRGMNNWYRRAGDLQLQMQQALYHAQAHSHAGAYSRMAGVIAWCAFDYASLMNSYRGVKCPGVADVFRIPKLGAAFYQAQVSPRTRLVIQPDFYWDFGPQSPRGPGKHAAIFSNCDRLDIFVAGKLYATAQPDRENFAHLEYPPFFCDLDIENAAAKPELHIDGYVGDGLALSKSFSSDPAQDQFFLAADDAELTGDGVDATRLVFKVVDKFGAERAFAGGKVAFEISGPGMVVGDNPFALDDSGGVGAIWVRTVPNGSGEITVQAVHSSLGVKSVTINVQHDVRLERI
ncbi:MAG TPA: glycoside hydrolase family 2 TIM barrel-domain containing protein [Candidatus Limnocylindrales bacterium]|nr:glycoside hydrolase family 2 TIM barrel-domain containing protein [Candidatus Limnocylindrales bacterium]